MAIRGIHSNDHGLSGPSGILTVRPSSAGVVNYSLDLDTIDGGRDYYHVKGLLTEATDSDLVLMVSFTDTAPVAGSTIADVQDGQPVVWLNLSGSATAVKTPSLDDHPLGFNNIPATQTDGGVAPRLGRYLWVNAGSVGPTTGDLSNWVLMLHRAGGPNRYATMTPLS